MINLKNFQNYGQKTFEAQEEDEWIIRKLRSIIKRTKKIPSKQRWHILVGLASTLLTLNTITNLDLLVRSIGNSDFSEAFKVTKKKGNKLTESLNYTVLDMSSEADYQNYINICQLWIDKQKYNLLNIDGGMMARSAKYAFDEKGNYVPPEFALAQLTLEGGFDDDAESRPIRTNNPFNVGNVDSGENKYMEDVEEGIKLYYILIASSYLDKDITVEDLLQNFVRKDDGNRYARDRKYEIKLSKTMKQIKDYTKSAVK